MQQLRDERPPRGGQARIRRDRLAQMALGRRLATRAAELPLGGSQPMPRAFSRILLAARATFQRRHPLVDMAERLVDADQRVERFRELRIFGERRLVDGERLLQRIELLEAAAEQHAMSRSLGVGVAALHACAEDLARRAEISERDQRLAEAGERVRILRLERAGALVEADRRVEAADRARRVASQQRQGAGIRGRDAGGGVEVERASGGLVRFLVSSERRSGARATRVRVARRRRAGRGVAQRGERALRVRRHQQVSPAQQARSGLAILDLRGGGLEERGGGPHRVAERLAQRGREIPRARQARLRRQRQRDARQRVLAPAELREAVRQPQLIARRRARTRCVAPGAERLREGLGVACARVQLGPISLRRRREVALGGRVRVGAPRALDLVGAEACQVRHAQPQRAAPRGIGGPEHLDLALVEVECAAPVLHRLEQALERA